MKLFLPIIMLLMFLLPLQTKAFTAPVTLSSAVIEKPAVTAGKSSFKQLKKETEKKLGRKLKFTEKVGLWAYSRTATNDPYKKKGSTQAILGFIFGICSLVVFPLFSIPGLIISGNVLRKEKQSPGTLDSTDMTFAKIGLVLSIIGLVFLIAVIVYIGVILSGVL